MKSLQENLTLPELNTLIQSKEASMAQKERELIDAQSSIIETENLLKQLQGQKQVSEEKISKLRSLINDNKQLLAGKVPASFVEKELKEQTDQMESMKKELDVIDRQTGEKYSQMMVLDQNMRALQQDLMAFEQNMRKVGYDQDAEVHSALSYEVNMKQGQLNAVNAQRMQVEQDYNKLNTDKFNFDVIIKRKKEEIRRKEQELIVARRLELIQVETDKAIRQLDIFENEYKEIELQHGQKNRFLTQAREKQKRTETEIDALKMQIWDLTKQRDELEKKSGKPVETKIEQK